MNKKDLEYIIGIDVGTTSIKGVLLDALGNLALSASKEYILISI